MADVSSIRLTNIVSVTQGANKYIGVRSVNINVSKGNLLPIDEEGYLYVQGAENVGTPEFPVTTQVVFEQDHGNMLDLVAESNGDLVVVFTQSGGGANKTLTISNHEFRDFGHPQNRRDFGRPSVNGVAYSSDGSALPIAMA